LGNVFIPSGNYSLIFVYELPSQVWAIPVEVHRIYEGDPEGWWFDAVGVNFEN
jgi:hypothetical protein